MSIKLDITEGVESYKEDVEKDLETLEMEINSIAISLAAITKPQIHKIENLFTECENNVKNIIILDKTTKN